MFSILKNFFSGKQYGPLKDYIDAGAYLIDVRTKQEFASGHSKYSINIPLEQLQMNLGKIKTDKMIVVFCRSGNRSALAKTILENNGYKNVLNAGSWKNLSSITGNE